MKGGVLFRLFAIAGRASAKADRSTPFFGATLHRNLQIANFILACGSCAGCFFALPSIQGSNRLFFAEVFAAFANQVQR